MMTSRLIFFQSFLGTLRICFSFKHSVTKVWLFWSFSLNHMITKKLTCDQTYFIYLITFLVLRTTNMDIRKEKDIDNCLKIKV